MKKNKFSTFCIFCLVLCASFSANAQYDDLYFNPDTDVYTPDASFSDSDYEYYNESDEYQYYEGESYQDYGYEDDYDYYYSSRIQRFYRPYSGFGFFDPCYVDYFNYDPFYTPGTSIYLGFGNYNYFPSRSRVPVVYNPFGPTYVYGQPAYNPYGGYYGNPYGGYYNNPYGGGYYGSSYGYGYSNSNYYNVNNYYCPPVGGFNDPGNYGAGNTYYGARTVSNSSSTDRTSIRNNNGNTGSPAGGTRNAGYNRDTRPSSSTTFGNNERKPSRESSVRNSRSAETRTGRTRTDISRDKPSRKKRSSLDLFNGNRPDRGSYNNNRSNRSSSPSFNSRSNKSNNRSFTPSRSSGGSTKSSTRKSTSRRGGK